jgi:hypothetical protein
MNDPSTRQLAWALGLGGLIPFVGLAGLVWWAPAAQAELAQRAQILYAASILSFLGGLHWGFALSERLRPLALKRALVWSVLPSRWAWGSALAAPRVALGSLALGLLLAWAFDRQAWRSYGVDEAFLRMRLALTAIAVLTLLASAMAPAAALELLRGS